MSCVKSDLFIRVFHYTGVSLTWTSFEGTQKKKNSHKAPVLT